ncbi:MAG: FKBP-type peptidyl-prolyl cis-trans isomerase [Rikenellaceae bacterium]
MAAKVKYDEYKERNLEFIEEYRSQVGVKELFNGVLYREIIKGKGPKPTPKGYVTVKYKGSLINGKVFDSTYKSGRAAQFKLNELILGWRTALAQMQVGSRWEVVIPFNLGYGARGAGSIKPFSTLIFDIQLIGVE